MSKADVPQLTQRFSTLAAEPRAPGSEKLTGTDKYRFRQGDYRIPYEIDDAEAVVTIVKIGHRKDVHRK